jgi:hypothetical protein
VTLLIDGHNLIGAGIFADIALSDEDDEAKLIARLRVWKSRYQGKFVVIFDRGIPGGKDVQLSGAGVEVVFAADPAQADDLIRRRLRRRTPGLVLVTNDDALLREAAAQHVRTWRGEEFVRRMALQTAPPPEAGTEDEPAVTKREVEEWLALFKAAKAKRVRAGGKRRDDAERRANGRSR